jgi:hypothetical protein
MTTSTNNNQPIQSNSANPNIILVYLDDANNNADYFFANPNARLIPYNRPVNKIPSNSGIGPQPNNTENPFFVSSGVPASINNPASGPTDTSNIYGTNSLISNNKSTPSFDFSSFSLEGYSPANVDPLVQAAEGAMRESVPQETPPFNINIDPASFVLQNRGSAGQASFKCSITYDVPNYTGDFTVVFTKVS